MRLCSGLAAAAMAVQPAPGAVRWPDRFTAILWHSDLPHAATAALPGLGITAGRVFGQRGAFDAAALRAAVAAQRRAGLDAMVENVATDFYAPYHRFVPGQPVNAAFLDLLARYRAHPADPAVWQRQPPLADPAALAPIARRLAAHARALAAGPALYLSLGDETGIADLSAASDLDGGPAALTAWRADVRRRYRTIARVNRAWHAGFADWATLRPTSTDAALAGAGPVAGWLDFKLWTDRAFARALRNGTDAVHAGDRHALAAIEGAQRPGWGGYDYPTLAPAVDAMEAGEPDPAFALARAFNPLIVLLTTVTPTADSAGRLWRSLLLGGRGAVIWDEDGTVVRPDGTPGPGGAALAPVVAGLRGPLGTALIAARPQASGVAIAYSQASFALRWLEDRRAERMAGQDWTARDNDTDRADSPWRTALTDAAVALDHLGLHPGFVDASSLTAARLTGLRAVLLPQSIVLGDAAVAALRRFAARGGVVLADAEPGRFDGLGQPRAAPPLAGRVRLMGAFTPAALRAALRLAPVVTGPGGAKRDDASAFRFNRGRLLALQADGAAAAGPAVATLGPWRCTVALGGAVPTVLVAGAAGVSAVAVDGGRTRAACARLSPRRG